MPPNSARCANRVDQLRALADEQVTRAVQHQGRLLVLTLDRNKPNRSRRSTAHKLSLLIKPGRAGTMT